MKFAPSWGKRLDQNEPFPWFQFEYFRFFVFQFDLGYTELLKTIPKCFKNHDSIFNYNFYSDSVLSKTNRQLNALVFHHLETELNIHSAVHQACNSAWSFTKSHQKRFYSRTLFTIPFTYQTLNGRSILLSGLEKN